MTAKTHSESNIIETRDPVTVGDLIDEGFTWTRWLNGDTIPNVPGNSLWGIYQVNDDGSYTEASADFTIVTKTISGNTITAVWVTPLANAGGKVYAFLNTIITTGTRKWTRGFYLPVVSQ